MKEIVRFLLPAMVAGLASWVSVQITVARMEERLMHVQEDLQSLRKDLFADHEARIRVLETRLRIPGP